MQVTQPTQDLEFELVQRLKAQPNGRTAYIALAEFYEKNSQPEEARLLFNGVVPATVIDRFDLCTVESRPAISIENNQRLSIYKPETVELKPPSNADLNRNSVFETNVIQGLPECIDCLTNARFIHCSTETLYLDSRNIRISTHSTPNSFLLYNLIDTDKEQQYYTGNSILLSKRNSGNFYHWHFDVLPALGMLEAIGIGISQLDNIFITKKELSFQKAMLDLLGVEEHQIKVIETDNTVIHCERLFMVQLHNRMGMAQSRRHLDWIRAKFLPLVNCAGATDPSNKKIAIKRNDRGFTDNTAVMNYLKNQGYLIVEPEKLDYKDQVRLFANASHVVAPHGAAMALLVFCKPGTVVYEFYAEHVHPCFWSIASALSLDYSCLNCSDLSDANITNGGKNLKNRRTKSINLNLKTLEAIPGI